MPRKSSSASAAREGQITRRHKEGVGRYYYDIPGLDPDDGLGSVTTIIDSTKHKAAIGPWMAKEEREMVIKTAADLWEDAPGGPDRLTRFGYIATLKERLGKEKAGHKKLVSAGEIGTAVHARIEWEVKNSLGVKQHPPDELVPEVQNAFDAWRRWSEETRFQPLRVEQVIFSLEHRYAGTLDLYALIELPKVGLVYVIIDWKTGKRIYPEARIQNSAYRVALIEMGHHNAARNPLHGMIIKLPKRVGDPVFETEFIDERDMASHFAAFMHLKGVFEWDLQQKAPPF